jgi:hypothetical protein
MEVSLKVSLKKALPTASISIYPQPTAFDPNAIGYSALFRAYP